MAQQAAAPCEFECNSISSCVSINRIISYLNEYQTIDIKNISKTFNRLNRPFLTDDFNHVLIDHLGDEHSVQKARSEFESIHHYIMSKLKYCKLQKCVGYQRSNRNREKKNILLQNINDKPTENQAPIDDKAEYYIETLDTMHCFFFHTFDIGFRIKSTEFNNIVKNNDDSAVDDGELYKDLAMKKLSTLLTSKRKRLQNIRGKERTNKTKFITNIDSENFQYEADEEKQSNSKEIKVDNIDEKDEKKDDIKRKKKSESYSFGFRYNYWNENAKNYVCAKYKNMKYELLNNNIFRIDLHNFKSAKRKAKQKMYSKHAKKLISDGYAKKEYLIKTASTITRQHIMSILFYTDFDTLSYHFSSTFRALNKAEKNMNVCKLRNAEYANLSRLLCETVNAFGTKTGESKHVPIYYHGLNKLFIFSSFLATFNSPTSTTLQIEVAVIFARDNGAILELQKHSKWLSFFNCSWLSSYCNEDERLFFNPIEIFYQLKFSSIRCIAKGENYQYYIHALTALNYAVNFDKPKGKDLINKTDIKIIRKLMMNASSRFPQYIQDIFAEFSKKKKIAFKMKYVNKYYPEMQTLFFDDESKRKHAAATLLVKLVEICNAFPNCKSIMVDYNGGDWKNPKLFELTSAYFNGLLASFDLLNKKKNITFKSVKFDYIQIQNKHIFAKYKRKFAKQHWYMQQECSHQWNLNSITIKKCDEKDAKIEDENENKNYNKNKNKKGGCEKCILNVKQFQGCFNRQRYPENLLQEGESVFYSSDQGNTSGDWIIFEIVNLSEIKKIKIKNYANKKFLKNSGIKKISLWLGNEESMSTKTWHKFTDISGIKQTQDEQYFIIESNITTQQIQNQKLNLLKLIIDKNHGHKLYNCFYEFATFGIVL